MMPTSVGVGDDGDDDETAAAEPIVYVLPEPWRWNQSMTVYNVLHTE